MFDLVTFSTESVELRVVESPIGKVVPVVDIAKAIGYGQINLDRILGNNSELFSETLIAVTATSVFEQKSSKNTNYERSQEFEVKALNSYGVVGLLMKLDYNRIKDEKKKQLVLGFQKWAMQVLGDALGAKYRFKYGKNSLRRDVWLLPSLPKNEPFIKAREAANALAITKRTLQYRMLKGKVEGYQYKGQYVLKQSTFDDLMKNKPETA